MSNVTKNLALGAAATLAGATIVGATMLTGNNSPLATPSNNSSGSGGGSAITLTVKELHPSVSITEPADGDVFISTQFDTSLNFKDTYRVALELTTPRNHVCNIGEYMDTGDSWATESGANYTTRINLLDCQNGLYGTYKLKAFAPGFDNVVNEKTFYLARFALEGTIFDPKADPILMLRYGKGIGLVSITVNCAGSSEPVINNMEYIPEQNDDALDEVLLPFADKSVTAGTCTAEATAKKANGDPLNSQDISGATVRTTFTYTGL